MILFGHQVEVRSDQPSARTWGRPGQAPTVARTGKRFCLNAMSTISARADLHSTVFRGRFDTRAFLEFVTRLPGRRQDKIHVVLDVHTVHRSTAVTDWIAAHADRIELHFLPAYAPHLNPDELVDADRKRTLADRIITTPDPMDSAVRSLFHRVQKLPARVRGYFQAPHTIYASTI